MKAEMESLRMSRALTDLACAEKVSIEVQTGFASELRVEKEMLPTSDKKTDFDLLGKLRAQIQQGIKRRNKDNIRSTFESHKTDSLITKSTLQAALQDLGINVIDKEIDELLRSTDINNDGGLDFDEFSMLLSASSPSLEWLRSLPLAELVLDGLPKKDGITSQDQLRHLCNTSQSELEVSIQAIMEGLRKMLQENLAALKKAYDLLESKQAAQDSASAKFQIRTMSVGNVEDFYNGIKTRIGKVPMRALIFILS